MLPSIQERYFVVTGGITGVKILSVVRKCRVAREETEDVTFDVSVTGYYVNGMSVNINNFKWFYLRLLVGRLTSH